MGRLYADIIRRTCAESNFPAERNSDGSVNILIGGWSMGGMLSLEIAKVLTGDQGVKIIGLLMMDSMCTVDPPAVPEEVLDHLDVGVSRNMFLSVQAMKEALRIIREWDAPFWTGDQLAQRPRASLLRANDPILTGTDTLHIADIYRHDESLGWNKYDKNMFTEVMGVQGNHFTMFALSNIPAISKVIKRCLDTLERLGHERY